MLKYIIKIQSGFCFDSQIMPILFIEQTLYFLWKRSHDCVVISHIFYICFSIDFIPLLYLLFLVQIAFFYYISFKVNWMSGLPVPLHYSFSLSYAWEFLHLFFHMNFQIIQSGTKNKSIEFWEDYMKHVCLL